jgi:hypothetical protein
VVVFACIVLIYDLIFSHMNICARESWNNNYASIFRRFSNVSSECQQSFRANCQGWSNHVCKSVVHGALQHNVQVLHQARLYLLEAIIFKWRSIVWERIISIFFLGFFPCVDKVQVDLYYTIKSNHLQSIHKTMRKYCRSIRCMSLLCCP